MPLISVVMTSYYHDKYIALAIESVLEQTFSDFELIIVDDASTDRSQEIIRKYQEKDSRIRCIFHETNQGISRTTNDAFQAARGQYIAYVQSDDVWLSGKLEKQLKILNQNNNLIVWSDAAIIDDSGNPTGQLFTEKYRAAQRQKSGKMFSELAKGNYVCGQSVVVKTDVAKEILFDPRLVYANDYKFMLELSRKYEFYFIQEPLVKYRIHDDNSIHKNREIWDRDTYYISRYITREYGIELPRETAAKLWAIMGKYLHTRGHFRWAQRCFCNAIKNNPQKTSFYKKLLKCWLEMRTR